MILLVVLVLVIAGVVVAAQALGGPDGGQHTGAGPSSDTKASASAPVSSPPGSTAAESPSQPKSPSPSQSPGQDPAPSAAPTTQAAPATQAAPPAAQAALPDGYREYRDPSGFSLALPGWLADSGADYDSTSRRFQGRGVKLVVDWTQPAGASALADWQNAEPGMRVSNYQRVTLQAVTYRQWTNAADWEWTYGSSPRMHSLNRGFVTGDGKYGYALYWTMTDADWAAPDFAQARQTGFDSFQPAP